MELTQITLTERKNKVKDRMYLTITALPFRNGCSNQFWRRLHFKFSKLETSPVFPIDIDIAKDNVNKLTHKEYVESVEHKNKKMQEKKVMV